MTGRERLTAALLGREVDRVPIWLREGFPIVPGPAAADHFAHGWQAEPLYRELFAAVAPQADAVLNWGIPGINRQLVTSKEHMRRETVGVGKDVRQVRETVQTRAGILEAVSEQRRNVATSWHVKSLVETESDLAALAALPFTVHADSITQARENYLRVSRQVGDRGVVRLDLPSPMVCISGCMSLEFFLELSFTRREWLLELCEMVTERILAILNAVFAGWQADTTVNFGGSEQCTPPMMSPRSYDELVVPFDGRLIRWSRDRGLPVNIHCHGKVAHALRCMVEMGADATDPVEPPPQGDVTFAQAREIVGDRLTLVGNLEFCELESCTPQQIRSRVREILAGGRQRLILGASAGPIEAVSPRLADNYRSFVDAALEFGG